MEFLNNILFYFLSFIIVLSIIVFVHEFRHYYAAIRNKVKVEVFSIGFGREIYGWYDKRGTRWRISLYPLGGYVKMLGEDLFSKSKISKKDSQLSFSEKKIYQRFIIVLAGPLANFIFGIIGYALIFTFIGILYTPPIVNKVQTESPAAIAGLESGDKILSINNKSIKDFNEIGTFLNIYKYKEFEFKVQRDEKILLKKIEPSKTIEDIYGQKREILKIGISSFNSKLEKHNIIYSLYLGTQKTYEICSLTIKALSQMFMGKGSMDDLGGPVKIAQYSGIMLSQGFYSFIELIILLSISIGLINLFPIPMLDGGHLVMYMLEAINGKPLNKNIQESIFKFGFIFIISLAILLTYNDIIGLLQ